MMVRKYSRLEINIPNNDGNILMASKMIFQEMLNSVGKW